MANLTKEQEWMDRNGIERGGSYFGSNPNFASREKARAYNKINGTNIIDDLALERIKQIEDELNKLRKTK